MNGAERLSEIYLAADPRYTGRVSVPVLRDKRQHTIVNNESSEIIRMFNRAYSQQSDRLGKYPNLISINGNFRNDCFPMMGPGSIGEAAGRTEPP